MVESLKNSPAMAQLSQHPEAIAALKEMVSLMKDSGMLWF